MSAISSNTDSLARFLDVCNLRHQVIAQNVANVNTPGYHALQVSFEDVFRSQLGFGTDRNVTNGTPKVVQRSDGMERVDGNNVDIDREMGQLNKNGLLYQMASQLLSVKLNAMRSAISGR